MKTSPSVFSIGRPGKASVDAATLSRFPIMGHISRYKLLTPQEELILGRAIRKADVDSSARTIAEADWAKLALINCNLRLVLSLVKRFHPRAHPLKVETLFQDGVVGLCTAVNKFDPNKNCRFSTYAYWWIRQAVMRSEEALERSISIPRHYSQKRIDILKATNELAQSGESITQEAIASKLEITIDKLEQWEAAINTFVFSLDYEMGDKNNGCTLGEMIEDDGGITPLEFTQNNEIRDLIHSSLDVLSNRERQIIELRFGLTTNECMSHQEIGKLMSVTKQSIRQAEQRALTKLTHEINFRMKTSHPAQQSIRLMLS